MEKYPQVYIYGQWIFITIHQEVQQMIVEQALLHTQEIHQGMILTVAQLVFGGVRLLILIELKQLLLIVVVILIQLD